MKIREQVEAILRHVPAARNSDKELQIIYMQKFGMGLSDKQIETYRRMPSLETIRRVRQMLQEQGKYPASPEVDKARFEKFNKMRGASEQDVEEILETNRYRVLPWGE